MYLQEIKLICRNNALIIPDWQKLSRSDLCLNYLQYKTSNPQIADSYMSALLYSYWNVITFNYMHLPANRIISPEDCYDFVIDAITYVLDKLVWNDPTSSLYNDVRGPEKAINKVLDCRRINFLVASTRDNRKINYNKLSIEQLLEDSSDGYFLKTTDTFELPNVNLMKYISQLCTDQKYLCAFTIDAIMYNDFETTTVHNDVKYDTFDKKALRKYVRNMSVQECYDFCDRYKTDVSSALAYLKNMQSCSSQSFNSRMETVLKNLKTDKKLLRCIQ